MKPDPVLAARLLHALAPWRQARTWYIALSGGLDSTVLLHLLAHLAKSHDLPTLQALHVPLGLPASDLLALAERADGLYRVAKRITKPDGSIRIAYHTLDPLKGVHRRVKSQILDHERWFRKSEQIDKRSLPLNGPENGPRDWSKK